MQNNIMSIQKEKERVPTHLVVAVLLEFSENSLNLFLGRLWHIGLFEKKRERGENDVLKRNEAFLTNDNASRCVIFSPRFLKIYYN